MQRNGPTRYWVLGSLLLALSACADPLTTPECADLLDRYTAALVRFKHPEATGELIAKKQRAARELAQENPVFEFDRCSKAVSRRQFVCAMGAKDVQTMDRCLM